MIREGDGIHVVGETTVVADARSAVGDVNVVSHAHADHVPRRAPETVVCSALTAALARHRTGLDFEHVGGTGAVSLIPAGHVVGSRAALIETDGGRVLYTGDVSTRDRLYLDGFTPPSADVLVVETTYGLPTYRFPPQTELEADIEAWLRRDADRPVFLFGYALGRAQKLQALVERYTDRPLRVAPSIADIDGVVAEYGGPSFDATRYSVGDPLDGDEAVVLPSGSARSADLRREIERVDGRTAGFSGWALDSSYQYRLGYDAAFPLSDHCDFAELLALVDAVDPDVVYTHHGHPEAFASHVRTELGIDAEPLTRRQATIDEFGSVS